MTLIGVPFNLGLREWCSCYCSSVRGGHTKYLPLKAYRSHFFMCFSVFQAFQAFWIGMWTWQVNLSPVQDESNKWDWTSKRFFFFFYHLRDITQIQGCPILSLESYCPVGFQDGWSPGTGLGSRAVNTLLFMMHFFLLYKCILFCMFETKYN